jgi:hypothetical protein
MRKDFINKTVLTDGQRLPVKITVEKINCGIYGNPNSILSAWGGNFKLKYCLEVDQEGQSSVLLDHSLMLLHKSRLQPRQLVLSRQKSAGYQ